MKNILIMGIGRAGKTTLSEMIKKKYSNYNLVHSDSIKWAMIRAKGMEDYFEENVKEQKEFEHGEYFQRVLLEFFTSCVRNDINSHGYILESGQLEPKYVNELINLKNTIVICLGHGNLDKEDIIQLCRENDTEFDWSYELSYEELEGHAKKWADMNIMLKEECPKYSIEYIDTSKNREEALNYAMKRIEEQMN